MADVAAGRVTFMFTDVEGSTRLLARVGSRYPAMIETHRAIIADAAMRHGGDALPMEGDACVATFRSATAAIEAAVDTQRKLAAHDWDGDALRVRIGVHTGQAMLHHGELFGLDLHRAARIADAGHGRQVLVSQTAQALAADHLPAEIRLLDLGLHRLKDLAAPVHLFQVKADSLPEHFPALRTPSGDTHNLPAQTNSLVGRGRAIAAVSDLLRRHRLVTLTGPGGIGKTRLAHQVGAGVLDRFPDGVWLIELARVREAEAVPALIAGALGLATSDSSDPAGVLVEALRHKRILLILDNFEHVIDAAPLVSTILASASGVTVLTTSRERLALTGETTYSVPPLSLTGGAAADSQEVPDAATLFVDRARAMDPAFLPSQRDLMQIAAICRLVDGLPLAIELAAAQTRLLSVHAIHDRLHEGIDALRGTQRDLPQRQRSLRDTIAWSHQLLSDNERRLFARLSVFHGGCTLGAISAVCMDGLPMDPLAGVAALADKSMLQRRVGLDGDVTFEMLTVINEFASEALAESGEADQLHDRHAEYFADLAERADLGMFGLDAHVWEDVLNAQLENLRAALRWAFGEGDARLGVRIVAALNLFWYWGGPHNDGRRWIQIAMKDLGQLDDHTRGCLHIAAGFFAYADGIRLSARRHWERALTAFRSVGDQVRISWVLGWIAVTYAGEPDHYDDALALVNDAVALARGLDERPRIVADALTAKGEIARLRGDDPLARACYGEALAIVQPIGNERYVARLNANLAYIASHQGDHHTALGLLLDALEASWKLGHRVFVAWTLSELAAPELGLGRPDRAARLVGAAETALDQFAVTRQPADQVEHDQTIARLADSLGHGELDSLLAQGARLSLDEAVDYALGADLPSTPA
jgi:predicted ATPase/class 3 adenylate cyclase